MGFIISYATFFKYSVQYIKPLARFDCSHGQRQTFFGGVAKVTEKLSAGSLSCVHHSLSYHPRSWLHEIKLTHIHNKAHHTHNQAGTNLNKKQHPSENGRKISDIKILVLERGWAIVSSNTAIHNNIPVMKGCGRDKYSSGRECLSSFTNANLALNQPI